MGKMNVVPVFPSLMSESVSTGRNECCACVSVVDEWESFHWEK